MTPSTVIQLNQTVRIKRLRDSLDAYKTHHDDFPRVVLALAVDLFEARQEHESDQEFGRWLVENELDDLGKDDRAALVSMGEYPQLSAARLAETTSRSLRLIWANEIKPRVLSVEKPAPVPALAAEITESAAPEPEKDQSTKPPELKNEPSISRQHRARSPLGKIPNAEWVLNYVLSSETRTTLAGFATKRRNRPAWDLLIECIQNGTFGEPSNASITTPNLRLLFPWMEGRDRFVRSFDLTNSGDVDRIKEIIVPFLLKNDDRSPRVLTALADAVRTARIEKEEATRRQLVHQRHREQLEATPLPDGEQEIIAYGTPLWPSDRYSYEEIAHACWFVSFIFDLFGDKSPLTKRMNLLHAIKYIEPMLSAGVVAAIGRVTDAFVNNPNGDYKWPPKPPHFF